MQWGLAGHNGLLLTNACTNFCTPSLDIMYYFNILNNIYGCLGERENVLGNWCRRIKKVSRHDGGLLQIFPWKGIDINYVNSVAISSREWQYS